MGLSESTLFDQKKFLNEWTISDQLHNHHPLWTSKLNPNFQLEECPIFAHSEEDIQLFKTLFQLRRNSPELVTAHYLKQIQKGGLCTSGAQGKLYLEKIMLRLTEIEHVPYPDSLHLMFTVLAGYRKLVRQVGVFKVQQSQIGFTQNGEAKVWLDGDFSAVKPAMMQHSEQSMVYAIVQLIQDNVDQETTPKEIPSLIKYIFEQKENPGIVGFDQALIRVRDYANKYNDGQIPKYMECIRQVGVGKILQSLDSTAKRQQQIVKRQGAPNSNMWKSDVYQYRVNERNLGNGWNQKNAVHNQATRVTHSQASFNQPYTSLTKTLSAGQLNIQIPSIINSKPIPQYIRQLSPRSSTSPLTLPSPNPRASFQAETPNIKFNNNEGVWGNQRGGERPRFSHQVGKNELRQVSGIAGKTNVNIVNQQAKEGRISHTSLGPQVISPKFTNIKPLIQMNQIHFNSSKFPIRQFITQPSVTIPSNSQQQVPFQPISQPIIQNPRANQAITHVNQKNTQQQAKNNPQQGVQLKNSNNQQLNKNDDNLDVDNELVAAHEPIEKLEELNDSVEEEMRVEQVSEDGQRELELSGINNKEELQGQVKDRNDESQSHINHHPQAMNNQQPVTIPNQQILPNNTHLQSSQQHITLVHSPINQIPHHPTFIPHQPSPIHFAQQLPPNPYFIQVPQRPIQQILPIHMINGPVANRNSQQFIINGHQGQRLNQQQKLIFQQQPIVVQRDSRAVQQHQPLILANGARGSHIVQQVIGQPVMIVNNKIQTQTSPHINNQMVNHSIVYKLPTQMAINQQISQRNPNSISQQQLTSINPNSIQQQKGSINQQANQQPVLTNQQVLQTDQQLQKNNNKVLSQEDHQEQFQAQQQLQKQTYTLQPNLYPQSPVNSLQPQINFQQAQLIYHQELQVQHIQQQANQNDYRQLFEQQEYYQQHQSDKRSLERQQYELHQYYNNDELHDEQQQIFSQQQIQSEQSGQYYEGVDRQYAQYYEVDNHNLDNQAQHQQVNQEVEITGQNIEDYADVFNSEEEQLQHYKNDNTNHRQQEQEQTQQYPTQQYNHNTQEQQQHQRRFYQEEQQNINYLYQQQYQQHLAQEQQQSVELQNEQQQQDPQYHHSQIKIPHNTHEQPMNKNPQPLPLQNPLITQSPQRQSKISLQSNIINLEISNTPTNTQPIFIPNPAFNKNHSQPDYQPLAIHTRQRVNDLGNSPIIDFYKKDSNYSEAIEHIPGHSHVNSHEQYHQEYNYDNHNDNYNQQSLYDYYNQNQHQNRVSSSIDSQSYKQELYDTESPQTSEITTQYHLERQEVTPREPLYRPLSKRQQQEKYSFDQYFDRTLSDNYMSNAQNQYEAKVNSYQQSGNQYETTPVEDYSPFGSYNKYGRDFQRDVDNVAFSFGKNYESNKYTPSGYSQSESVPNSTRKNSRINNTKDVDLQDGKSPSFLLQQIRKITSNNKSIPSTSLYNPTQKYSYNSAQTSLNSKDIYNTFNSYSNSSNNYTNNNNNSFGSHYADDINGSRSKSSYQVDSSSYSRKSYQQYEFQPQQSGYSSSSSYSKQSYGPDNYNYGQNSALQDALSSNYQAKDYTYNYANGFNNIPYTENHFSSTNKNLNQNNYNTDFTHTYQPKIQLMNDDEEYRVDFDPEILADIQKLSQ